LSDDVSSNGDGSDLKLDLAPVRRDTPKVGRTNRVRAAAGRNSKTVAGGRLILFVNPERSVAESKDL